MQPITGNAGLANGPMPCSTQAKTALSWAVPPALPIRRGTSLVPTSPGPRLSHRARSIVDKCLARAADIAGASGESLRDVSRTLDPQSEAGQEVAWAYIEAQKRALAALTSWQRYGLVWVESRRVVLRTPKSLDLQPSTWVGLLYTLEVSTGECSCPDCQGTLQGINAALRAACPQAGRVLCKHWCILAILVAQGLLSLPEDADVMPEQDPTGPPIPPPLAPAPPPLAPTLWSELPGFESLPARLQRELTAVLISSPLVAMWERDGFVTREEGTALRALLTVKEGE